MGQYAVKRFITIVPVLLGVSIIVFSFIHLIPGDPAVAMLGERATPQRVAEVRAQLGLDKPLYQQFFFFINAVRGLPLPQIPDEDIAPIVAYMKKAL